MVQVIIQAPIFQPYYRSLIEPFKNPFTGTPYSNYLGPYSTPSAGASMGFSSER